MEVAGLLRAASVACPPQVLHWSSQDKSYAAHFPAAHVFAHGCRRERESERVHVLVCMHMCVHCARICMSTMIARCSQINVCVKPPQQRSSRAHAHTYAQVFLFSPSSRTTACTYPPTLAFHLRALYARHHTTLHGTERHGTDAERTRHGHGTDTARTRKRHRQLPPSTAYISSSSSAWLCSTGCAASMWRRTWRMA